MTPKQRLEALMREMDVLGSDHPNEEEATFWIEACGPVSIELHRNSDVSISTPIYLLTVPDREICWGAIADFNSRYLHEGGWRLFLDGETAVMVTRKQTLANVEEIGIGAVLEDFVSRCGTCTCWYIEQIAGGQTHA